MRIREKMGSIAVVESAWNEGIISEIESEGFIVVRLPEAIMSANLPLLPLTEGQDCVFFLDAVSCDAVLREAEDLQVLLDKRVGAADTSVVEVLRGYGVHADIVPMRLTAASVYGAIDEYLRPESGTLVFIGGSPALGEEMLSGFLGGDYPAVDSVAVQSSWVLHAGGGVARALLAGGAADRLLIGGAHDVVSVETIMGAPVREVADRIEIVAASKESARLLSEHGVTARVHRK